LQQQGAERGFTSGELTVDLVRRLVRKGVEDVKLSPKEYDILEQLVIHAGKVLTHKHLLREVWRDESIDPQYLRVYVRQLRQKIESDPSAPRHVLTEPGVGYRLV
jgi:two-component system KDP operon response regulator KdpE